MFSRALTSLSTPTDSHSTANIFGEFVALEAFKERADGLSGTPRWRLLPSRPRPKAIGFRRSYYTSGGPDRHIPGRGTVGCAHIGDDTSWRRSNAGQGPPRIARFPFSRRAAPRPKTGPDSSVDAEVARGVYLASPLRRTGRASSRRWLAITRTRPTCDVSFW